MLMSILNAYTVFIHLLHTLAISFEEDPLDRLIFNYLHEVVYAYKNHFTSPFHVCGLHIWQG